MGRVDFQHRLRDLILADDPVATLRFPVSLGLMPLYVCWDPRPETLDQPAFAALREAATELRDIGIEDALDWIKRKAKPRLRDWLVAVEIVEGGRDFLYRHYGAAVSASVGRDNTGTLLSLMTRHSASARVYQPGYDAIAKRRLPLYTESVNTSGLVVTTWRRLIVPTFAGRRKVDGFLVANVPVGGLPEWPLVLPRGRLGRERIRSFETARGQFNGLSAGDVTRQIEANIRGLLGGGQIGIAILSSDLAIFRYVSPQLAKMLRSESIPLTRRGPADYLADPALFARVAADLASGAEYAEIETEMRRIDGTRLFARLTFGRLDYNMGPAIAVWIADLTEHKRLQEELARAKAEAEREAQGRQRLWASLAHDIKTPLNAVVGFASALESLPKIDEARVREYGGLIRQSGKLLSTLIDDLLDLSRMDAGKFALVRSEIDPAVSLGAALDIVRPLAEAKRIELRATFASGLKIKADAKALARIAVNVLSNAVKFTPEGGRIEASLARGPKGGARIAISDTGRGIPSGALRRVLKPFEQADPGTDRDGGTGLGLSIVKGLVDLHGGHLDIKSAVGKGTTVDIHLP